MRNSKHQIYILSAISALLMVGQAIPVYAQDQPQQAVPHRFELSASAYGKGQKARKETDAPAMEAAVPQQAPVDIDQTKIAALQGNVHQDDSPGAFLQEMNVDWSHWVSVQADRWYFSLKSTENQLGLQFATVRPAMIQFTCYADGTIGNVILRQSSGVPSYDRLQIEALMSTVPVPNFPSGTQRTSITLCQGWESHPKQPGESDFQPGSFGKNFPAERVRKWFTGM